MSSLAVGRGPGDLEQPAAMCSMPVGRGGLEDLELWLAGLFTAAELAAADLLLQLSVAGGVDGDKAASTSSTPTSYSPRSCCECACAEEDKEVERVVVEESPLLPLASTELDRRARKRYRFISDIYAATSPVTAAAATITTKKRKRRHLGDDRDGPSSSSESSVEEATRYGRGGDY